MTDNLMKTYLEAKKDREFMSKTEEIFDIPTNESKVEDKISFAYLYVGWLIGKGKWTEFVTEKDIFA